jgi:hypothetical protein
MQPNALTIAEITYEEAKALVDAQIVEKLGTETPLESMTLTYIAELLEGRRNYAIDWEGGDDSRTLRGVVLGDTVVGSVENTLVRSIDGTTIGSAEYLMRYAGESGCHQKLLIILF